MPDWRQEIRRRLGDVNLEPTRETAILEELAAARIGLPGSLKKENGNF